VQGKAYHGAQLSLPQSLKKEQEMEHTTMVESPQYTVEKKEDSFEIKTYAARRSYLASSEEMRSLWIFDLCTTI
jgi:hypothetical protein